MLQEQTDTVISYQRCNKITINNPSPNSAPMLTFEQERITLLPENRMINDPLPALFATMTDPTISIPILDTETFFPTEKTISYGEIYAIMVSLYKDILDKSVVVPQEAQP